MAYRKSLGIRMLGRLWDRMALVSSHLWMDALENRQHDSLMIRATLYASDISVDHDQVASTYSQTLATEAHSKGQAEQCCSEASGGSAAATQAAMRCQRRFLSDDQLLVLVSKLQRGQSGLLQLRTNQ